MSYANGQMRSIHSVTKSEVEKLFRYANDFDGFDITQLDKCDELGTDCLRIYAVSMWDDGEGGQFPIEDLIVTLFPDGYRDECDFSNGFSVGLPTYTQWALWCGLFEPINFDKEELNSMNTITKQVREAFTLEFVSYNGKFPNQCSGVLTLNYNGNEHAIQYALSSGGQIARHYDTASETWDNNATKDKWMIDENKLPTELRQCVAEITELVNANIPFGCCGGCI